MKKIKYLYRVFSIIIAGLIITSMCTSCNTKTQSKDNKGSSTNTNENSAILKDNKNNENNALIDEDINTSKKQLPIILEKLLSSSLAMKEPIEDASKISLEDIHNFMISTSFGDNTENNPYDLKHLPIKDITFEETNSEGNNYTEYYRFIPIDTAQQIAYEVFGVKNFVYKNGFYHKKLEVYAIPEVGLNAFYTYKNLNISVENGSNIIATFNMTNRSGETESEDYGRYTFHFKIMNEDNHTFIRFLSSQKES